MSDLIPPRRALVCVVDDDDSMREALPGLLDGFGFATEVFSSAEEFLVSGRIDHAECLILDVAMPGMTGPELQKELKRRRATTPIVFISGHPDETLFPRLMAEGASACLSKPFSDALLLDAVRAAISGRPPRPPA